MKHLLILLLLLLLPVYSETVKLTTGEWPPYNSENISEFGLGNQIVSEAFNEVKINVKYGFYPWKRAYLLASRGEWDGSVEWAKNEKHLNDFYFSKEPLFEEKTVFFYRKDFQFDWENLEDLKGLTIGSTIGYYYGEKFKQAEEDGIFKVVRISEDINNLKKLIYQRIDLFACNTRVGYYLLSKLNSEDALLITNHPKTIRNVGAYLVISKKIKNGRELMDKFDEGFKKLKENGRYKILLNKEY